MDALVEAQEYYVVFNLPMNSGTLEHSQSSSTVSLKQAAHGKTQIAIQAKRGEAFI
jgi:hypothetical protein